MSLIQKLKPGIVSMLFIWVTFSSFTANYTEVIEVMDEITLRNTAYSEAAIDTEASKVWNIVNSSMGLCWPDGTVGYKTCNATDATVVGVKPYNGGATNVEHTIWYVDSDGFRWYVKDTYYIIVLEPSKCSVDFNGRSLMRIGESHNIEVNYPNDSKRGRYYYSEFSSSAPDVIGIDDDGKYTAKKAGKATITINQYVANKNHPEVGSYLVGSDSREFEVAENIEPTSLYMVENPVYGKRRAEERTSVIFTFMLTPEDSNIYPVLDNVLDSDNNSIITTSESLQGYWSVLSSPQPGCYRKKVKFYPEKINNEDETIWVFSTSNGLEVHCKVILYDPVESITLDQTNVELPLGKEIQLGVTVLPENATYKDLTWTSEDETIATVSDTGLVKALKKGNVRITVTSDVDEISAYCDLTVIQPVEAIYLSKSEINIKPGEFETLTAYVSPENADNKALKWKSGDEKVAKVENGTVMGISDGKTVVRAIAADDSGVSAECAVNVGASSEIEDVVTDETAYVKIFNLQGLLIYEGSFANAHLVPDYYIVVCDGKKVKVRIE